jgi:two-component system KDP operon response regulator KdpE
VREGAPEKRCRVLVVDDDLSIRRALKSVLRARSFDVELAETGREAIEKASERTPDFVVLDLSLPDMDGLEVCRGLRQWLESPILVLSVRQDEGDKIAALDSGADDYMTKPFSTGELLARLRALTRRVHGPESQPAMLTVGDLSVDLAARRVFDAGREIRLTRIEFDILAYLARNAGRVVTSRMILESVWGPGYGDDVQTLRVHVSNLRKKIEAEPALPRYVITEPGVGFRLDAR